MPESATAKAPLAALLPGYDDPPLPPDELLTRFVSYCETLGLRLYPAQEEAILHLLEGKHVVLATPTGSGKSLVATALHFLAMNEGVVSYYTCPIKALVNEKFFSLCQAFGPHNVGLLTGDAAINRNAPIICCTAEILANRNLREREACARYVVMDEFHYYGDRHRGTAWQIPLLSMPQTLFLLMSATLGDMRPILESLTSLSGRDAEEVKHSERPVPLSFHYAETPLFETVAGLLSENKAPIYLVSFTQRAAVEQAQNLTSVNLCSKPEKAVLLQELSGVSFDTPFGKDLLRYLRHGIGLHHAGLLPRYRLLVEKLSQKGLLKVISGTDTLGVGVNIPIRTVLLTQLCKFDGEKTAVLSVRDFLQIAGRAGRKGFDEKGTVVVQAPAHVIENKRQEGRVHAGKMKPKKVVKQKPPTRGYAHWDKNTFDRLLSSPPEPLISHFTVNHGVLLNVLQSGEDGYGRLVELIARCHDTPGQKRRHRRTAAILFRALCRAGIVELVGRSAHGANAVRVRRDLQQDFSLHQALSLYLLEAISVLDRDAPEYALDVLSLVESILENPQVVLFAQVDKLKREALAEMKARGMDYEERIAELDKIDYPKPKADFIYATFNIFAEQHPWVGAENIRPKSVARDMYERCAGFREYIREYGLARSEGVLLRYLSEVYRALAQTVPEQARTPEVEDVLSFFYALVHGIDSSLLDEWERLGDPARAVSASLGLEPEKKKRELYDDPQALSARVRGELHQLLGALAARDYESAAQALWPEDSWSAEELAEVMAPFWAEHARIDVSYTARRSNRTQLKQEDRRLWVARQTIVDPEGDCDWMLECRVDLSSPRPEQAPLLELVRVST